MDWSRTLLPVAVRMVMGTGVVDITFSSVRMLRNKRTGEVLRVLNTNVERADIIWNASMRKQIEDFLGNADR